MKSQVQLRASTLAASGLVAALAASSTYAAQIAERQAAPAPTAAQTAPARPPFDATKAIALGGGIDHSAMIYDTPGDGAVWARGANYKASFGPEGALYFPALGKRSPHDFQHAFSPDSVTLGGAPLPFEHAASAVRDQDRIDYERGSFVERYELAPDSMEQSFVFQTLPRTGDLVVHIPVASEMTATASAAGLEFKNEFGTVKYSNAIAIDARGARTEAATTLDDGAITIRVDADFLAHAALPLTIDPVVSLVGIDPFGSDAFSVDCAWDNYQQLWLAVYEETYSATDTDVYARFLTPTGALSIGAYVDYTTNAWATPRVANLGWAHQFLVVGSVAPVAGGGLKIQGRTVQPNGTIVTQGAQFDISGAEQGDKVNPDVGGDPYSASPQGYYCVVWERRVPVLFPNPATNNVDWRIVGSDSGLGLLNEFPTGSLSPDSAPSISKSNDTNLWLMAWIRNDSFSHSDIYAAHITYLGGLADGPFGVSAGNPGFDFQPCASSPLTGTQRSAISFTRRAVVNGQTDIMVAAIDGTTVLNTVNLSVLENAGFQSVDQTDSSIDSDGQHFVAMYSEYNPAFLYYDMVATDLFLSNNLLYTSQAHVYLSGFGLSGRRGNISGQHAVGLSSRRFLSVYDIEQNSTDHDAIGVFFDSLEGPWGLFCFGDDSGTGCPCGNTSVPAHGCPNSSNAQGAFLHKTTGTISTTSDSAVLQVDFVPTGTSCLFFQGTSMLAGTVFGDGLRCAGGTIVRLATKTAIGSTSTFPAFGDPSLSVRGGVPAAGGLRTYQVWYRNSAVFCTASTFNLSNGVSMQWAP
jgi:hypothetical protein